MHVTLKCSRLAELTSGILRTPKDGQQKSLARPDAITAAETLLESRASTSVGSWSSEEIVQALEAPASSAVRWTSVDSLLVPFWPDTGPCGAKSTLERCGTGQLTALLGVDGDLGKTVPLSGGVFCPPTTLATKQSDIKRVKYFLY